MAELRSRFRPLDPLESDANEPAVLSPLAAEGDIINLSGPAGSSKTTIAGDIAIARVHSARGGSALGGLLRFANSCCCRGDIAIIDGENSPQRWQSLIRRKLEAEGLDPREIAGTIHYVKPAELGLYQTAHWRDRSILLADVLHELNVTFAIIDSLGRTWAPDDINSTAWVQQGLTSYRDACKARNITTLALSHTRRRSGRDDAGAVGPLGSSMQEGQVDTQIMAKMDSDGRGVQLTLLKCRRAHWIRPGSTVTLRFTEQFGYEPQCDWAARWPHECSDASESPNGPHGKRAQIVKFLKGAPQHTMSASVIASQLGCSKHTTTNHLSALVSQGLVERVGDGPSTAWKLVP